MPWALREANHERMNEHLPATLSVCDERHRSRLTGTGNITTKRCGQSIRKCLGYVRDTGHPELSGNVKGQDGNVSGQRESNGGGRTGPGMPGSRGC